MTYEDIRGIYLAFKGQIKRKTSFSHTTVQQSGHNALPKKLNVNKMCTCIFFFSQVVKGNHLNDCQTHVALSFVGYAMFYMYCFVKGTNWILS